MANTDWWRLIYHGPDIAGLQTLVGLDDYMVAVRLDDRLEIYAPDADYLNRFAKDQALHTSIEPVDEYQSHTIQPIYHLPFFICPDDFGGNIPQNLNNAENAIAVHLNHDLAFGDGHHPTTAMCLSMIRDIETRDIDPAPSNFLDFGCGSGILSIAASKYFNIPGLAIDCDDRAVSATDKNLQINCIRGVKCAKVEQPMGGPYDLIMANVLANPLIKVATPLINSLSTRGKIILSGMLQHQLDMVLKPYIDADLVIINIKKRQDWATVCLQNLS